MSFDFLQREILQNVCDERGELQGIIVLQTLGKVAENVYLCNMENTFKIRTYGRMELAQLYCPDVQPKTAWRKLKEWIDYYPHLNEKLSLLGRTTCTRTYSPPQVRAIVEALGEP